MFNDFLKRLENQYRNALSIGLERRTIQLKTDKSFVSFTFDDFPRSAFLLGGAILDKYKIRGSYYASFGMMGGKTVLGDIFTEADVKELVAGGHEIGSHTFDHLNPWETRPDAFEDSIIKNQNAVLSIIPEFSFKTLAYPYTGPHPKIKRVVGKHFSCCRGGGQIPNIGRIDLNLLRSCFIDRRHREDLEYFRRLLQWNNRDKGWLIFSTHDISVRPSAFGCNPEIFENIVREAVGSSATILPICDVYSQIVSVGVVTKAA